MPLASMTTGAAATSRCVRKYTAAATQSNTTPTKNTKRPSRRRSRRAPTLDEQREAWKILESTMRTATRVLGPQHPTTYDLKVDCKRMALKLKKALLADGRRQKIEMLKQALIKTKLHGELQAQMAKDPEQDAPPPRTFARGWLDG